MHSLTQNNKSSIVRVNKRKLEFVEEYFRIYKNQKELDEADAGQKRMIFRFLLSPESYQNGQLTCAKNVLVGESFNQTAVKTQ